MFNELIVFYIGIAQSPTCRNVSSSRFFLKVHNCSPDTDERILGTMMLGWDKENGRDDVVICAS